METGWLIPGIPVGLITGQVPRGSVGTGGAFAPDSGK